MNALLSKEDILALIREGRVVSISDKGAIKFKEPGVEASSGAERVRRHRERKRNAETIGNDVTHVTGVTHVTPPPLPEETHVTPTTTKREFTVLKAAHETPDTLNVELEVTGVGRVTLPIVCAGTREPNDTFADFCAALGADEETDPPNLVGLQGPCYLTIKNGAQCLGFGYPPPT